MTVSHRLVSLILRCHVDCSWLLSNVFLDILVVASVLYILQNASGSCSRSQ